MIEQILAALRAGSVTTAELSRRFEIEPGVLERLLEFMVRKGLIQPLRRKCGPPACAGCPYRDNCCGPPATGYELTEVKRGKGG